MTTVAPPPADVDVQVMIGAGGRKRATRTHEGWGTSEAAELAGTTYRCLHYWAKAGVFGERLAQPVGSGNLLRFSPDEVAAARAVERAARVFRTRQEGNGGGSGSRAVSTMACFRRVASAVLAGADRVPLECVDRPSIVVQLESEAVALLVNVEGLRDGLD